MIKVNKNRLADDIQAQVKEKKNFFQGSFCFGFFFHDFHEMRDNHTIYCHKLYLFYFLYISYPYIMKIHL